MKSPVWTWRKMVAVVCKLDTLVFDENAVDEATQQWELSDPDGDCVFEVNGDINDKVAQLARALLVLHS